VNVVSIGNVRIVFRFSWKWRRRSTIRIMERTHEKKQRKHYTPEEKVAILRQHLQEQVSISELCDKHGVQPRVFYRWQKEFFENGAAAFQPKARPIQLATLSIVETSGMDKRND
jgi:transposase-like protein